MRIALIGWYGHDNAGDERILAILRQLFAAADLLLVGDLGHVRPKLDQLNSCDLVLLGGGGLILRGFGVYACAFRDITVPFACIGISVEAVHADNQRLVEVLKDKSEFILVRDARSQQLLGASDKVIVGPDLTFLAPFSIAPARRAELCGLNLRPWNDWAGEYKGAYHRFMSWTQRHLPAVERCYPGRRWQPGRFVKALGQEMEAVRPVPLYTEEGVENDQDSLSAYCEDVPSRFDEALYEHCRYFVGMRLHSLIFACQRGIPFVSLSYQPKNVAFCRGIGMEELSVDLFSPARFRDAVRDMRTRYDDLREGLVETTQRCQRQIRSIINELKPALRI